MNTRLFFFSVAAIVLAACTQMENPSESNVPITLTYSTVAATETKAAQNLNEGTFASGESVKVRISNTGADSWTDYTFTTAAAGAMTAPDPAPYYPAGSQKIDIVAYYPATAGTSFSVATDQTADASYKASDLMFASVTNQAKQAEAVNLVFSHKMAKLNVNITAGTGVSSITKVNILNVKPTVSFNQATGVVGSADGTATSIVMSNNGAVIIPAQTINGELLSIVTDKGMATYSVADKVFEAGNLYTINITVNLRAVGTTTAITGWTSEGTVTVNPVTKQKTPPGLEAIDMGNGLKWANMNVGAESVTGYGDYFAWGETMPYYQDGHAQKSPCTNWIVGKTGYNWISYSWCRGTNTSMIKYCNSEAYGDIDNKTVLEGTHDAACANWGGTWRMPTDDEWKWLIENCTWEHKPLNGVIGMLITSHVNGHSIFLPDAGFRGDADLYNTTSNGYYWSSSLYDTNPSFAWYLSFGKVSGEYKVSMNFIDRCYGLPVRPVSE